MTDSITYEVTSSGEIIDGSDPAIVKARIKELTHASPKNIAALFSGACIIIKKTDDHAIAQRYAKAFSDAGIQCSIRKVGRQILSEETIAPRPHKPAVPVTKKPPVGATECDREMITFLSFLDEASDEKGRIGKNIRVLDKIPKRRIKKVLSEYVSSSDVDERILLICKIRPLYNSSLASKEIGFTLSNRSLYVHLPCREIENLPHKFKIPISEIKDLGLAGSDSVGDVDVKINGASVGHYMTGSSGIVENVFPFLRKLSSYLVHCTAVRIDDSVQTTSALAKIPVSGKHNASYPGIEISKKMTSNGLITTSKHLTKFQNALVGWSLLLIVPIDVPFLMFATNYEVKVIAATLALSILVPLLFAMMRPSFLTFLRSGGKSAPLTALIMNLGVLGVLGVPIMKNGTPTSVPVKSGPANLDMKDLLGREGILALKKSSINGLGSVASLTAASAVQHAPSTTGDDVTVVRCGFDRSQGKRSGRIHVDSSVVGMKSLVRSRVRYHPEGSKNIPDQDLCDAGSDLMHRTVSSRMKILDSTICPAASSVVDAYGSSSAAVRSLSTLVKKYPHTEEYLLARKLVRVCLSKRTRLSYANKADRQSLYSVGDFERNHRRCHGYLVEKKLLSGKTIYRLQGYGSCAGPTFDIDFNDGRYRGKSYKGVMALYRYDGAIPQKFARLKAGGNPSSNTATTPQAGSTAATKKTAPVTRAAIADGTTVKVLQDTLKDGTKGPPMAFIPAGSFRMGSPSFENGRDTDEGPQHRVSIRAFAMGKHEVTFAEYDRFTHDTGRDWAPDAAWGRGKRPAIYVSWNDARAYAEWLSKQTGQHYRLPSEAEWEYAARAGTISSYWWGEKIGRSRANCKDCGGQWDGKKTVPVGLFPANAFGLHDTAGNVWEWVQDCYHKDYTGAPTNGAARENGSDCHRVIRGGSWNSDGSGVRSAVRYRSKAGGQFKNLGFRLVRDFKTTVKVLQDTLKDGTKGPPMAFIPAGRFRMGSRLAGWRYDPNEGPQHPVRIRAFAIGRTEITFADYDRFTRATGRKPAPDSGWGRGKRPVINVSWNDANAYIRWLSKQTGQHYRLPSEAEWEYAARARTTTPYWWGAKSGRNLANCNGCERRWYKTVPVGSFRANAFGLYDTAGNVSEWVQDCYHKDYTGAPEDGRAWGKKGGGECNTRVTRGGSWYTDPRSVRSAYRYIWSDTHVRSRDIGFRLARDL